jgi:hypothetical protein
MELIGHLHRNYCITSKREKKKYGCRMTGNKIKIDIGDITDNMVDIGMTDITDIMV